MDTVTQILSLRERAAKDHPLPRWEGIEGRVK
jgi:hypothetical protein